MNARGLLAAGLLSTAPFFAQAQAQALNTAKLDSLFTLLAAKKQMMGSLALSRNGQVVYRRAFGAAQLEPLVPASLVTRYRVGSISKMFTAVLIFQLIDEQKLTLGTTLDKFFPQVPNAARITIDQLLSHHSGIHDFTNDKAYEGYMTQPQTQAALLGHIAEGTPSFEPGAKGQYSNSNFVLLGFLVEKLTGQPYAQSLQQRIVLKAGLKSTSFGGKMGPAIVDARSYEPGSDGGWKLAPATDMSIPGGAGAIVSTPTDLNRFLEALFGGKLVSAGSLAVMQTLGDGYGRGLFQYPFGTQKAYGHTGGIDGFVSMAAYLPDDKVALSLCCNAQRYSRNEVMIAVLSIYYGRPYRLPDFQLTNYQPVAADLDRCVGTYSSTQLPLKITLTKEGTALKAQATGQSAFLLEPVSAGVFKFDPAGLRIEIDPTQPMFTLKQGGGSFVFTKE